VRTFRLNPELFEQLLSGRRTLDVRAGDFEVGCRVRYEEWSFALRRGTGRWVEFIVADVEEHPVGMSLLRLVQHCAPRQVAA